MLSRLILALAASLCVSEALASTYIPCIGIDIPVPKPKGQGSGQYKIYGRLCSPLKYVEDRLSTLQVLVHGATYTVDYWSGLGAPGSLPFQDQYSWILYAANQGYPTLSLDRLCNGNSSHPNGTSDCTLPANAATIHSVIQLARGGSMHGYSKGFSKVILVGHSLGSAVSNGFANKYPKAADAIVLTGFTKAIQRSFTAVTADAGLAPAAQVFPNRFGNLGSDYLTFTNKSGAQLAFYYGQFVQRVFNYDYAHRGTNTIGEDATILSFGENPSPRYKGAVFVLNGNNDFIFCSETMTAAKAGKPGNCSAGFTSHVKSFYPNARAFAYHNTPNTGHCLNLHTTAQQSYKVVHHWLAKVGF